MNKRTSPLDKILGRLDNLDSVNLTNLIQRLARERRLLETVFNTIQDGILVTDENGIIQYANATALRLTGLREKQIGNNAIWKQVPDLAHVLDRIYLEDDVADRERVVSQELELTYPERRYVRLYMVPLEDAVGAQHGRGYTMVLSDMTEDKTMTDELIENERVASVMNLAAGVAHELGNPLNSLNIHLQLMGRVLNRLQDFKVKQQLDIQLEICRGEVRRLDRIIENFLEAVRPNPPDLSAELDLHEVLAEVLKVQQGELEDKGTEVDVEVSRNLPFVLGDRNQIKQVLFNLIKNAMEAVPTRGRLEIRTRSDDEFVNMQIRDNGPGIPADVLPRIYEPYFTTKEDGHGLGMMIVQRIVRDHGGQIGIESRPGQGTTITLRFPRKDRRARMLESSGDGEDAGASVR